MGSRPEQTDTDGGMRFAREGRQARALRQPESQRLLERTAQQPSRQLKGNALLNAVVSIAADVVDQAGDSEHDAN
jgi:hypothetical protein